MNSYGMKSDGINYRSDSLVSCVLFAWFVFFMHLTLVCRDNTELFLALPLTELFKSVWRVNDWRWCVVSSDELACKIAFKQGSLWHHVDWQKRRMYPARTSRILTAYTIGSNSVLSSSKLYRCWSAFTKKRRRGDPCNAFLLLFTLIIMMTLNRHSALL